STPPILSAEKLTFLLWLAQFSGCCKQIFPIDSPLPAQIQKGVRQRCTDRQRAAVRTNQDCFEGVQGKALVIGQLMAAVALVSQHRIPDGLQVASDLVHAPADRDD